jgi:lipid A 3-O-deacylase
VSFEWVPPYVADFPLAKLLLFKHRGYSRYGLAVEEDGYTPTSISNPAILYGDRPFAACLMLKTFDIAIDPVHNQRFSSSISTGVIGQAAGGMQMQTDIHRWLHNITPHGWPNQVHNDVILNYQVNYEKQLITLGHYFSLDAAGMARAGTLSDKAGGGITMMMGYFDSPYKTATATKNNFRIYAYEHPGVEFIGYDATLQGGVFNHTSPYTVPMSDITRITFNNRFGFVVVYRRLYLEYFQSFLSQEFRTGDFHVWGGVQVAVGF